MNAATGDLFDDKGRSGRRDECIADGAVLLPGFALDDALALLKEIDGIVDNAPYRHMQTPGGLRMAVAMTNCGSLGWISDRQGYRYAMHDPHSGRAWPALPGSFQHLAARAAERAGYSDFEPDACLINRYVPGTRLSLHQDRDERDYAQPIVSVSLGIPATFLFGGMTRSDRCQRISLAHGDVVVWGGPARLRFHGVLPLKVIEHAQLGACRINLTLRKAG
ncbi:MAG: DNA oxidative demethylase AlkB [Tahibacter sp.]